MHTIVWSGYPNKTYMMEDPIPTVVRMHHNGDFSGDVDFVITDHTGSQRELSIPFEALERLVGQACLSRKIDQLERWTGEQYLAKLLGREGP